MEEFMERDQNAYMKYKEYAQVLVPLLELAKEVQEAICLNLWLNLPKTKEAYNESKITLTNIEDAISCLKSYEREREREREFNEKAKGEIQCKEE